jgi:hypothetical protein
VSVPTEQDFYDWYNQMSPTDQQFAYTFGMQPGSVQLSAGGLPDAGDARHGR